MMFLGWRHVSDSLVCERFWKSFISVSPLSLFFFFLVRVGGGVVLGLIGDFPHLLGDKVVEAHEGVDDGLEWMVAWRSVVQGKEDGTMLDLWTP